MGSKIDSVGVYRGNITEEAVSTTQKSNFPQAILRLLATEKFVDDAQGMEHFGLKEPAWVDWASYNEEIVAYLVLFKSAEDFNDSTKLLNYDQLQLATGWDGSEFDTLANGQHVGTNILFRVENNEYEGKTSLQVNWVDNREAPPQRQLKTLDGDKLKVLSGKLAAMKKPVAPAKPGKPGATPSNPTAAAATKPATPVASPTAPSAKKPATTPATAPKSPSKTAATTPPPAAEDPTGWPDALEQGAAWELVLANKGANSDKEIEEAWLAACAEVGENKDQDAFKPTDWAKIAKIVKRDMAL